MIESQHRLLDDDVNNDTTLANFPIQIDHFIQPSSHTDPSSPTTSTSTTITTNTSSVQDDHILSSSSMTVDIHAILDKNLYQLYEACTQHHHNLQMKLYCKPIRGTLLSLNFIPFLTRQEVEITPSLRYSFINLYQHLHQLQQLQQENNKKLSFITLFTEIFTALEKMGLRQIHSTSNMTGCIQCTIIAQVLIECREIFHIQDMSFNETIQGDSEEKLRDVFHVVRYEIVMNIDAETGVVTLGHWQITDWDDLLGKVVLIFMYIHIYNVYTGCGSLETHVWTFVISFLCFCISTDGNIFYQ